MPEIRGITISIGYGPILEMTLARNMRHLPSIIVATSPEDEHSQAVARSVPGVELFISTAATRHGAFFNKGLLFEECWDHFGRDGWWLIHDADILFPDEFDWGPMQPDTLYGARRRCVADPSKWNPGDDWRRYPMMADGGPVGFWQLANSEAPNLRSRIRDLRCWYDVSFAHAGGGDAAFLDSFPPSKRKVLPIEVLHFGERDRTWFGTDEKGREIMKAFIVKNGWSRSRRDINPKVVDQVGDFIERVEVPGYTPSKYELPFVKRAQARKQMESDRRQTGA